LNWPIPASSAATISAAVLPTPEKTIISGAIPAASARRISPTETTSAPMPCRPSTLSTARLGFDFTAKAISLSGTVSSASRNTRA
jgi:hypothetical protein